MAVNILFPQREWRPFPPASLKIAMAVPNDPGQILSSQRGTYGSRGHRYRESSTPDLVRVKDPSGYVAEKIFFPLSEVPLAGFGLA